MLPALLLPAVFACASAGALNDGTSTHAERRGRALGSDLPHGCLYDGRWHTEGSSVPTREACLRCSCVSGALWCRRRACAPLPEPPPPRCHVLHRRGACCPELHCPNGVTMMEQGATARFQDDDFTDVATSSTVTHACVEGGTIYAAGSAMASSLACEQCFCLGGARRCVRPRCLPPPPGCVPRPAAGACCPQRYYCNHESTKPPQPHHNHDCEVDGQWVQEGDRVTLHNEGNCTACFCLHGSVRCQPLSCAPPLMGCEPLLRPGECCAHQYKCNHNQQGQLSRFQTFSSNSLSPTRNDDRAFHSPHLTRLESTTKNIQASIFTMKHTPIAMATKNHYISTTKVKRKTDDTPSPSASDKSENLTSKAPKAPSAKLIATTEETTTETTTENVTDQPDGTMKIIINGTINCTAELSSTSLPLNMSANDTERIKMEALPRIPIVNTEIEAQTYSPNDIITDRNINGNFDENETFTINVTSSLRTNTSLSPTRPVATTSKLPVKIDSADKFNSSKKTKEDYDYDYTEPTLPPSLPNLKIIPFVAADAVVEDNTAKDVLSYPVLDRQDNFPVYYPSANNKDTVYATRREDVYNPTQYPVFVSDKEPQYPALTHSVDLTSHKYHNDLEYTVSSSIGSQDNDGKPITKVPPTSSTFDLETPAVNLFSPPVETEGGFIPKGPGIIDEYFAVYPSTPSGPSVPHLTTSMQLDTKGECVSADGHHVSEGDVNSLACSECHCSWGELQCAPKPCHTPPHCTRRPASTSVIDLCCGDLVCEDIKPTSTETPTTTKKPIKETPTTTKEPLKNITDHVFLNKSTNQILKNTTTLSKNTTENISKGNTTKNVDNPSQITSSTENIENITTTIITTTGKHATTTITPIFKQEVNDTSQEYEDEDDDEGFSLGSVLKLLLSDTYDTSSTTTAPPTKPTTKIPIKTTNVPTAAPTRRPSTLAPFIPMPPRPYIPPKIQQNTVNRIDHLVLGEATAIKKTTPRPVPVRTTTKPPPTTTRPVVEEALSVTQGPRPPNLGPPTGGVGLLKLAGCNIYGRMYRVGRIIAELSTPCQECWCTEFGVQCKQLGC